MIDPTLMRTLVAIGEERGIGRAAERLNLTQQAVSGQVKRLEAVIGRKLFRRDGRGTTLSPDGEVLLAYARRAIALESEVRRHFRQVPATEMLRIGVSEGFTASGLPPLLRALRTEKPDLEIRVVSGRTPTLEEALGSAAIDLAIGIERPGEGRGDVVLTDRVRWVGDVAAFADPAVPVRLAAHPAPSVLRSILVDALTAAGRPFSVVYESESRAGVRAAVLAGIAITGFCFTSDADTVADIPTALPDLGSIEMFVRKRPDAGPAATAMIAALREIAHHLVAAGVE